MLLANIGLVVGFLGAIALIRLLVGARDPATIAGVGAILAAPQHHKLLFENNDVRVLEVQRSAWHSRAAPRPPLPECSLLRISCSYEKIFARRSGGRSWSQAADDIAGTQKLLSS
jgi:hypothetical protein